MQVAPNLLVTVLDDELKTGAIAASSVFEATMLYFCALRFFQTLLHSHQAAK